MNYAIQWLESRSWRIGGKAWTMASPDDTNTQNRKDGSAPSPAEINAEVERILSSGDFAQSKRLQEFLRFIVGEALAGRGEALKEYTIAVDVFERSESFDPQTNSIVRVEANRLRNKLNSYNAIEGRDDPVHIVLAPGSYMPTFLARKPGRATEVPAIDGSIPPKARKRSWELIGLTVALTLVVAAAAYVLLDRDFARRPAVGVDRAGISSVVVLPLRNLSGDPDQEYFSDGLTDALITSLAREARFRVISFTSAMAYKNANRPISEIAEELNVEHVIEGAVLRSSDRVRISAQLVEAATSRHLWAEIYERPFTDVLTIQDDVVRRIVASLTEPDGADGDRDASATPMVDPVAYEAQLRGRFFLSKMTENGLRTAIDYFRKAIALEPDYAVAQSGMATCYCLLGGHGFELVDPREGMPTAKAAVMKALELDESQAEPHAFLGIIRLKYEWDWPGAEAAMRRSLELNPSYAQARVFYSYFLEAMGRQDEAVHEAEAARAIDPLSPRVNVNLGWQYIQAGRLEDARQQFERTAELDPNFWGVHWGMGHYFKRKGDFDGAIVAFQRAIDAGGGYVLPLTELGQAYAIAGRRDEAREVLQRLSALAEENYVSPVNMASIYVGLGDFDAAFEQLDRALELRSRSLAWLKVLDNFDPIRSDPRYQALLDRIGLPG